MAALCGLCGGIRHKQLCWGWHAVVPHDQGACIGQQCGLRAPHEAPLAAQVHPVHLRDLGFWEARGMRLQGLLAGHSHAQCVVG